MSNLNHRLRSCGHWITLIAGALSFVIMGLLFMAWTEQVARDRGLIGKH